LVGGTPEASLNGFDVFKLWHGLKSYYEADG